MLWSKIIVYSLVSFAIVANLAESTTIIIEPSTAIVTESSTAVGNTDNLMTTPATPASTVSGTSSSETSSASSTTVTSDSTTPTSTVSTLGTMPTSSSSTPKPLTQTIAASTSTPVQASSSARPMPKVNYQKCSTSQNDCKNDADCLIGHDKICVCKGNFYGPKCNKEGNPIFKPLVYALGGTCGFLLLVVCISLVCSCKNSNRYKTSEDLDSFNNVGLRAKGVVNGSYGD